MSQQSAMQVNTAYSLLRGAFIASHGLVFYIVKAILPLDLMPLYHYPYAYSGFLPLEYILAPVAIVLIATIVCWSTRYTKAVLWGCAFYLATVFPAIQLIPVGHARAADRYTYVPLIGIFFLVGMFIVWLWKKVLARKAPLRISALCLGGLAVIGLVCLTSAQTGVWKSNRTLWHYVIKKNPYSYIAYNNLGGEYHRIDADQALYYYKMAAQIKPDYPDPFINICNIYLLKGDKVTAVSYCLKGLENAPLYIGIANACAQLGDIFQDINPALSLEMYENSVYVNPDGDAGYTRLCTFYLSAGEYGSAHAVCSRAIRVNPDNALAYEALGNIFMQTKDYDRAMANYAKAVSINPYLASAHHNLALIYYFSKQYEMAVKHYNAAIALVLKVNPEFQKEIEGYMHNAGRPAVGEK
jgi:Flp pilus assembly protein TadD